MKLEDLKLLLPKEYAEKVSLPDRSFTMIACEAPNCPGACSTCILRCSAGCAVNCDFCINGLGLKSH